MNSIHESQLRIQELKKKNLLFLLSLRIRPIIKYDSCVSVIVTTRLDLATLRQDFVDIFDMENSSSSSDACPFVNHSCNNLMSVSKFIVKLKNILRGCNLDILNCFVLFI